MIGLDFNNFCECLEKILNYPVETYKKLFFGFLDFDEDGFITEKDLFNIMRIADEQ
jgi:Ca2+-binding EF-hand superfamily protein